MKIGADSTAPKACGAGNYGASTMLVQNVNGANGSNAYLYGGGGSGFDPNQSPAEQAARVVSEGIKIGPGETHRIENAAGVDGSIYFVACNSGNVADVRVLF